MGLTDGLHIPPISLREMSEDCNSLGQPIGPAVPNWSRRTGPPRTPMMGRFCRLERLDVERHVADLWAANSLDCEARMWTYLPDSGRSTSAAGTRPDARGRVKTP